MRYRLKIMDIGAAGKLISKKDIPKIFKKAAKRGIPVFRSISWTRDPTPVRPFHEIYLITEE